MPLHLSLKERHLWDERAERFYDIPATELTLEHSLLSITAWESKWKKPWFAKTEKTGEQWMDYIYFMIVEPKNCSPDVVKGLTADDMEKIKAYIVDPMTATTINAKNRPGGGSTETLTNELVYYYMFSLRISKECETWHINRLLMLLQVFGAKDGKQKKMSHQELAKHHASLNEANRKRFHTKG